MDRQSAVHGAYRSCHRDTTVFLPMPTGSATRHGSTDASARANPSVWPRPGNFIQWECDGFREKAARSITCTAGACDLDPRDS